MPDESHPFYSTPALHPQDINPSQIQNTYFTEFTDPATVLTAQQVHVAQNYRTVDEDSLSSSTQSTFSDPYRRVATDDYYSVLPIHNATALRAPSATTDSHDKVYTAPETSLEPSSRTESTRDLSSAIQEIRCRNKWSNVPFSRAGELRKLFDDIAVKIDAVENSLAEDIIHLEKEI